MDKSVFFKPPIKAVAALACASVVGLLFTRDVGEYSYSSGHRRMETVQSYNPERSYNGENLVWVVGNGRTGTNFLGEILLSHSEIGGENERKPEFTLVTNMAVRGPSFDEPKRQEHLKRIVSQYKNRSEETYSNPDLKYHSDKSHPALFFAEDLHEALPKARMVGMNRCVYPTVASCVRHEGVRRWFRVIGLDKPNPFLGVTEENLEGFSKYSLPVQCAMRWATHQLEYERVVPLVDPESLMIMDYRDLLLDPESSLRELQDFLGLDVPFDNAPEGHPWDPLSHKAKISVEDRLAIDTEFHKLGYDRLIQQYCHPTELEEDLFAEAAAEQANVNAMILLMISIKLGGRRIMGMHNAL
eukprot:CAMPEP_0183704982 /NCGR_PEP_ID=MMETSP0737-20130205/2182_1 /TAXON_ID=385413 /ORGANISM="Thalassiosira miniscula, Strain CCMP1093" /LENGTH=356 /DNA_ID=CAMNT_0025932027 /DNA_START=38 /DNA_END=1106 /DNA_ORIENTATION=-